MLSPGDTHMLTGDRVHLEPSGRRPGQELRRRELLVGQDEADTRLADPAL